MIAIPIAIRIMLTTYVIAFIQSPIAILGTDVCRIDDGLTSRTDNLEVSLLNEMGSVKPIMESAIAFDYFELNLIIFN
jgi:hypothetical protein